MRPYLSIVEELRKPRHIYASDQAISNTHLTEIKLEWGASCFVTRL